MQCSYCSGYDCDNLINDAEVICENLSCSMFLKKRNGETTHERGCYSSICNSVFHYEFCQSANGIKECRECCFTPYCNSNLLNGNTYSVSTKIVLSKFLIFSSLYLYLEMLEIILIKI